MKKSIAQATFSLVGLLTLAGATAQSPTPGFNTAIPEQVMTPNEVKTRIGTLNFVDGVPTTDTTRLVYDHLDFLRGVEVPQFHTRGITRGDSPGECFAGSEEQSSRRDLRSVAGFQSAPAHG